jgi:heme ABC exporter ATP-binding subunit CcmA
LIAVDDLRVVFGRTVALDAIDVELGPGIVGLFGPNASGKSTFLRVVAGLLAPARGDIRVAGVVPRASDESFRRQIGYVGHLSGLYEWLTVEENLHLFAQLYGAAAERVVHGIDSLQLGLFAAAPVGSLSAGTKRRVAVARALLHEPRVLLLDEPYANLDDDAAELVSAAVTAWRAPDRIAVIATHGAKRVRAFADSGIVLQRGRLARHTEGFRQS